MFPARLLRNQIGYHSWLDVLSQMGADRLFSTIHVASLLHWIDLDVNAGGALRNIETDSSTEIDKQ